MVTEERVKELAYTLWEQEGRPDGKDVEHYYRAKQMLEEPEPASVIILPPSPAPAQLVPVDRRQDKQVKMQVKVTGDGQPIVLVPGGLTGWLSWDPHTERLSKARKVIQVQLLNVQYGFENRELPSRYSVKTESRGLSATLDELELINAVDFAAWSYGALVTLDYALDNPNRVRSLVLIEPPANWVLHALRKVDAEARQNEAVLRSLRGDISEEKLEQFLCAVGFCPPGQSPRQLPQWPLWVQYRQALRNSPAVITHKDDLKRLRAFQRPVLLVKGTGSAKFLHQIIDVLSNQLPRAEVVEMPAGHAPQIVSMDRFLELMKAFQASVSDLIRSPKSVQKMGQQVTCDVRVR